MKHLLLSYLRRLAAGLVLGSACVSSASPMYQPAVQVGTVTTSAIDEASGLAASRLTPGVLWTHNDSGDSNRLFALSSTGSLLGTFNLTGASSFDWEDLAVGPGPASGTSYLFAGDIGDNSSARSSIQVYRVPEPTIPGGPPTTTNIGGVDTITLNYPDGARNAESLIVDPLTGDLYIVTKTNFANERIYRAPKPGAGSSSITLQYLNTVSIVRATGGSIAPDGSAIIVRTLTHAFQFDRDPGESWADALLQTPTSFTLAAEEQGESIAFAMGGSNVGFYTLSEGSNQPLYFYAPVPEPAYLVLIALAVPLIRWRRPV